MTDSDYILAVYRKGDPVVVNQNVWGWGGREMYFNGHRRGLNVALLTDTPRVGFHSELICQGLKEILPRN